MKTLLVGLTILFVALKLLHKIDWSWVWVLAPVWGGVVFIVVVYGILYVLFRRL